MSDLAPGFRMAPDGIPEIYKSPAAILDYSLDWLSRGWLAQGETIASATWATPDGLAEVDTDLENGIATIWLSGGVVGTDYVVPCTITTSDGRTDTRSIRILCRAR